VNCPFCQAANPDANRFCGSCGAPLQRACGACGATAPAEYHFCGSCGAPLADPLNSPAVAAAPAALTRYVPKGLAEKILATRGRIEGEQRQVTVLFCDLAGSTRIAERLDPEDYRQLLDAYLEHAVACVYRYEGIVNQLAGDGLMAIFGAPIAHDDDAARACRAALDVQAEMRVLSCEWQERLGEPLRERIGINTGPVIVGSVGSDLRMDYSAVGETTNVASRIEACAPPGESCLSDATRRLVSHAFETDELSREIFKGKSEPITVYRLVREVPRRERRHQALRGGLSGYRGRTAELALVRDRWDAARSGSGQVVFVTGEAGIGKSRLVYEFRRMLEPGAYSWLEGQCVSYATRTAYLPIVDLLRGVFEIDETDSARRMIEKIETRCRELGGAVREAEPFYRDLLAVDPDDERLAGMWEEKKIGFIFEAVRDLLHALAHERPVVLLIEDVHWIDASSEQLLRRLLDTIAALPVLALVTHRSEYRWPHADRSYFSQLRLAGLSPKHLAELAQAVLGRADLPAELRRVIAERSDGNPFFVEEIAKALQERGILSADLSRVRFGDEVPATVQEVILARIDRLDDPAKRALQVAAVIGREFTVRLLERLYERPDGAGEALGDLRALELIYEKNVYPELSYMFKHALTHDVAYQTLLRTRRVELHRQVAALVEELYFDRLPEFYETLAFQYRRAELPEKAARYALLSAQRAVTHLAPEAEHLFREAAELAGGGEELEDVYLHARTGLGDLLILRGEIDAANDCFREALRLATDPKTRRWLANKVAHRHFVERDGVRLAYYIQGEGEPGEAQRAIPIVCLHPLIQGSYSFQVPAQRLCQDYCVVYMDPRGTGASDTTEEPFEFDTRVADALAVVEALPHEKVILHGDSDGGRVALELYHAMPERVEQLIIFGYMARASAAPDYPAGHSEEVMKRLRHTFLERPKRAAIEAFFNVMSDEPGMSAWREFVVEHWDAAFDEQEFRAFLQSTLEADARHLLPGVRAPTLIIAAERDGIPVAQVRYLAEKIPGARFALIKGASHMAPWTAIETFLELLTTFIRTGTIPREEWEA